jgi:hypothetical protein
MNRDIISTCCWKYKHITSANYAYSIRNTVMLYCILKWNSFLLPSLARQLPKEERKSCEKIFPIHDIKACSMN